MRGKVYLVGAGPGDTGLITCRGKELLKRCQVVVYDRLASEQLLNLVSDDCRKIDVGKRVGKHPFLQNEINEILVREAKNGYFVVRLKGGDPFVFGRGGEEIQRLQEENIPYEVIPGITSAIAVPEWAGIPVTHRGVSQSFHVITGHTADGDSEMAEDIKTLAKLNGTLIFLMGVGNLEKIVDELESGGRNPLTPVAIIENGTMKNQRVTRGNLATICKLARDNQVKSPAIILVGNVVNLDFQSRQNSIQRFLRVGVVGTEHMFLKMRNELKAFGGEAVQIGCTNICIKECGQWDLFCQHLKCEASVEASKRKWIAFTSANGVEVFFQRLREKQIDVRRLWNYHFAVIGEGTKVKLQEYGFYSDFMSEIYSGEGFGKELAKILKSEDEVYIPRAEGGSQELVQILLDVTKYVFDMEIYNLNFDIDDGVDKLGEIDYLTFFNETTACEFMNRYGKLEILNSMSIAVLGQKTFKALSKIGFQAQILSEKCKVEELCNKIREDYTSRWND